MKNYIANKLTAILKKMVMNNVAILKNPILIGADPKLFEWERSSDIYVLLVNAEEQIIKTKQLKFEQIWNIQL